MSGGEGAELTKSWVFVDSAQKTTSTSSVEEVENDSPEPHVDSDTDSISVISESGCSYKTDEEEFVPATNLEVKETVEELETTEDNSSEALSFEDKLAECQASEDTLPEGQLSDDKIPEVEEDNPKVEVSESVKVLNEIGGSDKFLYFATSAVCAVILIGLSVAVQHYYYRSADVNNYNSDSEPQNDFASISRYVDEIKAPLHVESHSKKYNLKRKKQTQSENKIIKLPGHDKIVTPDIQSRNNDLTIERDVDSKYKLNKNKNPAVDKENCDDTEKRKEIDEHHKKNRQKHVDKKDKIKKKRERRDEESEENCTKKLKEFQMKENFLREKEKFLIEKERDLLKKEMKLKKGKDNHDNNKYEKKSYYKKEDKPDGYIKDKKNKFKSHKKYDDGTNPKINKMYKNKGEKKHRYSQNQPIVDDEHHKKHNISGQWYINMHKARNHIRQKEHASDWVFDRAHLRSLKRNKAHWYFQWMVDRARLRVNK